MSTIGQHISNLRGLINQYSRNSEPYTDQFLYEVFVVSRSKVLKDYLTKNISIPDSNYSTFCMELEKVKPHTCECVPDGLDCLVLRTKYQIPSVISSSNKSKISLQTLGGKPISIVNQFKWQSNKQMTDYVASNVNGYYYLWNVPLNLKLIEISGVFNNPFDLATIKGCDTNGNNPNPCFTLDSMFPLDDFLVDDAYRRAMGLLQIPMSVQQDLTNDSNNVIKI